MAFSMKRNDTRPIYKAQLTQPSEADPAIYEPVNLTTATQVRFLMKKDAILKVNAIATIADAAQGRVQYTWAAVDTDESGTYNVEWEVSWGTDKQTFPTEGYNTITIQDDLNDA
jgi:5-hydroxyisourate hydrolase-like protein (transthyretin family)